MIEKSSKFNQGKTKVGHGGAILGIVLKWGEVSVPRGGWESPPWAGFFCKTPPPTLEFLLIIPMEYFLNNFIIKHANRSSSIL